MRMMTTMIPASFLQQPLSQPFAASSSLGPHDASAMSGPLREKIMSGRAEQQHQRQQQEELSGSMGSSQWPIPWTLPAQAKEDQGKLTVVLDIDETLVHTTRSHYEPGKGLDSFTIRVQDEVFTVLKRPNLDAFLHQAAAKYELISFTAGVEEYSRAVLRVIDPDEKYFKHQLFRQHCSQASPNTIVKDLRIINRCHARVVLVDNTLTNFFLQPENGVPITTFLGDVTDNALNVLLEFLSCLHPMHDVRPALRATFHLQDLFGIKPCTTSPDGLECK